MPHDVRFRGGMTPDFIRMVKTAVGSTKERAKRFGISISSVHKIRQGLYDDRMKRDGLAYGFCDACRATVQLPCVICSLKTPWPRRQKRPRIDARQVADPRLKKRLEYPVAAIGLWSRVINLLENAGYETVAHVLAATADDLKKIPNINDKTIDHIRQVVARLGFRNDVRRAKPKAAANSTPG